MVRDYNKFKEGHYYRLENNSIGFFDTQLMNQNSNKKTKDTFYISEGKSCSLSLHIFQLIIILAKVVISRCTVYITW